MTCVQDDSEPLSPLDSGRYEAQVAGIVLRYLDYRSSTGLEPTHPGDDPRPKMLCIHGGAAHAHWFDFVAGAFATTHRVLSLDLRGHGDSDWAPDADYSYVRYAADVCAFIDALRLGPVVLVGHSMGGMVSLVTAANCPTGVAALVVIDSMMQMSPQRARTLRDIGQGTGRTFASQADFVAGFKIRPHGSCAPEHVIHHMAQRACRQDEDGRWLNKFDRNVYAKRHPIDGYDYWGKVRVPALLVAGGESDRITPEVRERVARHCPAVQVREVAGAGHHVTLDNPLGCRRVVSDFLSAL